MTTPAITPHSSKQTDFDVIVLGVGGMGSAACVELARRGCSVLGLEQFTRGHDRGSSHGESRIIRKAYFEHPDYVPLLHRTYELWERLEASTGRTLFSPTGLILSGPPEGETIRGARFSAVQYGIELQNFSAASAAKRFPGFQFPADHEVAFEPGAGTLFVDTCITASLEEAIRWGAVIRDHEPVLDWTSTGDGVHVRTATAEYRARSMVITAGAWASQWLSSLQLPLTIRRKFVGWFACRADQYQASQGTPTYFFEQPHGTFYGFPSFDGSSVKIAEHSGGQLVADPAHVDRECHPSDLVRLTEFLGECLPDVSPNLDRHAVCLYTLTPDQHFVIDLHPQFRNVALAAGFSGHGFKFCPVVGAALADLILSGTTDLPIGFLARSRAGLLADN